MKLRKLELRDAEGIKEWMDNPEIMQCFKLSQKVTSLEKIREFISHSFTIPNRHYAIANEKDEYLGTISLKNIDIENQNAEYAIVLRPSILASGVAKQATDKLLQIAFQEINLHKVYLNVLSNNTRAIKFYEKINFKFEGEFRDHIYKDNKYLSLTWYSITKEEFYSERI